MALGEERFVGLAADFEGKLRMKNAILFIGRKCPIKLFDYLIAY